MVKKGLIMTLVAYFFIIQAFIVGAIWQDSHFYTLWCINLLFFVLFFFGVSVFSWDKNATKQDKWPSYPIVKEKIEQEVVAETEATPIVEEVVEEKETFRRIRDDRPISESNIEYIKTKINRTKRKPLREGSAIYRFLVFLIALLWLGGVLYAFWDSLDFIALIIGAFAMLIFIWVCFKAANLWRKSLFSSIYFLLFFLAMIGGILGLVFASSSTVEKVKDWITTFFDGVKGEEIVTENTQTWEDISFWFESTGSVLNFSLTWESIYNTWDENTWAVAEETVLPENTIVEQNNQPAVEEKVEAKVEQKTETKTNSTDKVTMIEAIKHLVKAYNIPLSKSTSSKFTYVSKSSDMYPYMKTALEKKMIGTNTDPQMVVSCDVYMVMKGIAEGWGIAKSANLKENYWNVAESKWVLNGCTKWAKVTYANL